MPETHQKPSTLPESSINLEQIDQIQQKEQQQSSSVDWLSGIDVVSLATHVIELASDAIETVGDVLANIDLGL